ERKLIVVTGKGGTGKSTVACALGLIAAGRGLRTVVVEVGQQHHAADLFDDELPGSDGRSSVESSGFLEHTHEAHAGERAHHNHHRGHGEEVELGENLWSTSIDPDRAMIEWLQTLTGRISARLLAASSTFHYFAAAAPGAKELVSLIKVRELCEGRGATGRAASDSRRKRRGGAPYDLVVLDAPATGHALAMLRSPQTFSSIVRVGPLAEQAGKARQLLEDPRRSGYVAVTHASEMAVTETLELEEGLRRELDRDLDAVVVNGALPRRFTREELGRIEALEVERTATLDGDVKILSSAVQVARTSYERARVQQSQIARLRRQRFAGGAPPAVLTVPFAFVSELDLTAIRDISGVLERKLER
ncbi:MAG TPA: ArsA-related P-loop ATPase, partial [Solirubrobacteraceae bacterium]|nr:ArsA-related P-loop ATPase [Solirubrobacteraceae bacterium]